MAELEGTTENGGRAGIQRRMGVARDMERSVWASETVRAEDEQRGVPFNPFNSMSPVGAAPPVATARRP